MLAVQSLGGHVDGEGAGFVTLERYESAVARGAPILAQLHGFGVTSDAFDAIQFDPSGDGIRRALETALRDSQLTPSDIDWIRASGAGGASQDASEIAAIGGAFGTHKPTVTSLESTMGHTNGAGPAMGLVSCVSCQQAELMPATLNFVDELSSHAYTSYPMHRARKLWTHSFPRRRPSVVPMLSWWADVHAQPLAKTNP